MDFSLKKVLSLAIFNTIFTTSIANPKIFVNFNESKVVTSCILNILQKYVHCNNFISVMLAGGDYGSDVLKAINDDTCYTVTLKSSDENHLLIWTDTYIVLTVTADDLGVILSQLSNDLHWNPRARFIIQTNEMSLDKISHMFKILLARHIYNAVILNLSANHVLLHTYFPFGEGKCGRSFEDIINLGVCVEVVDKTDLFLDVYTDDNMKNCTINLILHENVPGVIPETSNYTVFGNYVTGMEQYLLENIGSRENFTYESTFIPIDNSIGSVYPNRTVTGMFIYLQAGVADIAVGGLMLTRYRADVFDYIWGYNFERLSLYTPAADTKSWKNLSKELGPRSWTLTVLCYCLVCGITIVIATLYPDIAQERLLLVLKIWGFFFQGNTDRSLLKVKRLRLLLCCWIWFTFFITNFYNTAMYSMVTSQVGQKRSFDIDDLNNLPFKPCISDNIRFLFLSAFSQHLPESVPSPKCKYLSSCFGEVGSRTDLYTIGIKQSFKLRAYEFTNIRGQSTIDVWDFSNPCVPVMYIKKGHPLKDKMEKYARYMYEGGLMQKHFEFLCLRSHSVIMRKSNSFIQVRLQYLSMHFAVLGVGILVSTVVFLVEVIAEKML